MYKTQTSCRDNIKIQFSMRIYNKLTLIKKIYLCTYIILYLGFHVLITKLYNKDFISYLSRLHSKTTIFIRKILFVVYFLNAYYVLIFLTGISIVLNDNILQLFKMLPALCIFFHKHHYLNCRYIRNLLSLLIPNK